MFASGYTIAILITTVLIASPSIAGIAAYARGGAVFSASTILIGWMTAAIALAVAGVFVPTETEVVPSVGVAVVIPLIAGIAAFALSPGLRGLIQRISLPSLTAFQVYRVAGGIFVIAWADGLMPAEFAMPAGIGDVIVGLTAPVAAYALKRGKHWPAVVWNLLGLADLVIAVTMGILTSPSDFQATAFDQPNTAVAFYPFVLIPVFLVPLSILLHLAGLWRLRRFAGFDL